MTDTPLLEVDGLTVGYGSVEVVHGIDLRVERGEIVCLLGANGAGKTTTLLAISGLIPAKQGTVAFDGMPLAKRQPDAIVRAGLVQVPEDRSLFASLTVLENLQAATGDPQAIDRVLGYFPALADISSRRASVLSGGEQQMLALARALALSPRLLVIDEMSLGLAPLIVEGIFGVLRQIVADTGCSVLMVEQHVHLALQTADRAYVMSRGEIVRSGTAAEVEAALDEIRGSYLGASVL
jgi:branched-chain amino acid transport system ATP-binding protein